MSETISSKPHALGAAVGHLIEGVLASGPVAIRAQKRLMRRWKAFVAAWDTDEPGTRMAAFFEQMRARKAGAA